MYTATAAMKSTANQKAKSTIEPFTGPLFIVGMPRSGTKLLRDLLNRHPKIGIPDIETRMLPTWTSNWQGYGSLANRQNFHRFYRETVRLSYFCYMDESARLIPEDNWYQFCRNFSPAGVFEALIRHDAKVPYDSDRIWGDKSPLYFRHVPLLRDLFGNARFIHIVRDVRDYCLSINKAWGKNMFRAAQRWKDDVSRFHPECIGLGGNCLEVRYEDLLADPESTLKGICLFLEIEWNPLMLHLSRPSENLGDAKGYKEIKKNNKEKYLRLMPADVRRKIEELTASVLRAYDYPVKHGGEDRRLSSILLYLYKFLDGINLFAFEFRENTLFEAIKQGLDFYKLKR